MKRNKTKSNKKDIYSVNRIFSVSPVRTETQIMPRRKIPKKTWTGLTAALISSRGRGYKKNRNPNTSCKRKK